MADEEVSVVLSAVNKVSAPAAEAANSLAKYQAALDSMRGLESGSAASAAEAAGGLDSVGAAAARTVAPHGAAHKALGLVTGSLVEMAGGSAAAGGAVRVLDSVMFSMAATGGAVSLGFVGVIAAAAALGYAFRASAEETKKQQEALDKMTESAISAVSHLDLLDAAQKKVAGVGGGQLLSRIMALKEQYSDLTAKMKENTEAARAGQSATVGGAVSAVASSFTGGLIGKDTTAQANEANLKMMAQAQGLAAEIRKLQNEYDALHKKQGQYVEDPTQRIVRETQTALRSMAAEADRSADSVESIGRALGDVDATMPQVIALANQMGVTYVQAAGMIHDRFHDAFNGMVNVATSSMEYIGVAAANAAMGMANAWQVALSSIIQGIVRMAIEFVAKHIVMAQAAALVHEVSTKGIIGLVTGLASIGAIAAIGATLMAAVSKSSAPTAAAQGLASSGSFGATSGSEAERGGFKGTPISSAQSSVTNNISVHVPVEAMDLSSVSDMQLKNLASRVGRVLAEAAGQGQFSLVGA